ncbi:hypothetical protein F3Y22_tig00111769pilonHSYRG00409 [Hibiscus syriacus]|uniref:Uncharacterized protein n=1 Tax=Hibiscus syriacus TaxID=106335 RepID=A0A6A2YDV2_HIBSY|nr:uncharacterized protein LOC120169436 [Hibiscus syriacus]KAE8674109.1 hypothetical protein F3Y22_tig00111769pilonHSYRG00409 [Hibiscus syriacus]
MDATRGRESTELLDKILAPCLEDAGLEDCALPPDSIHEAFLKAASAIKSRSKTIYFSDDEVEAGFVDNDPFHNAVVVAGSSHPPSDSVEANERLVVVVGGGGGEPVSKRIV